MKVKEDKNLLYFYTEIGFTHKTNAIFGCYQPDPKAKSFIYYNQELCRLSNKDKAIGVGKMVGPLIG